MARQAATVIQNSFIKGLITENTAINFPQDACTEAVNVVFDETGRITRRGGIDVEQDYVALSNSGMTLGSCFTEYIWDQVAGLGTVTFFVQQEGTNLKFFDISTTSTVTGAGLIATISLSSYLASGSVYSPANFACQYAKGNGELIVVNSACDPIYITYSVATNSVTATRISIKYRDFLGIAYTSATYTDIYRPVFSDINAMKTDASSGNNGARHFYNLLNQGWWQGTVSSGSPSSTSAMGQWDTARTDMPSNSDRVESFRSSFTDSFDDARVDSYNQGNTLAAKGHFILNLGNADRQAALTAEGYSLSFSATSNTLISGGTGTIIHGTSGTGFTSTNVSANPLYNENQAWDTDVTTPTFFIGTDSSPSAGVKTLGCFLGKDYGGSPKTIGKATIRPRVNGGSSILGYASDNGTIRTATISYELRGHSSAPSAGTEGTLLGTASKTVTAANYTSQTEFTITSSDTTTTFRYVWIHAVASATYIGTAATQQTYIQYGTIELYDSVVTSGSANLPAADVTVERPSCVEWFASRAWYAGVASTGLSNNLYFSQIIEKPEQYGRCYQLNDPTSEALRDILPTDGGIIKIPEIGKIVRLYSYQTALLVFATNGVWIVRGEGGVFTPTNFNVRKISSLGTQSPQSFVDIRGIPIWWGEDGILQIDYNPQFDSFSVNNLTDETIRRFYLAIPPGFRAQAKGAYDVRESVIYWLYNDTISDGEDSESASFTYTKALCLNTLSGAFFPLEFFEAPNIRIHGIVYSVDSIGSTDPLIKFTTSWRISDSATRLHYCDLKSDVFTDYTNYAVITGDQDDTGNYDSSFKTAYATDGELLRFVQPNYVSVFLEQEDNASCYMRGIFDFTNSGNSGKWGSAQQVYNNTVTNRDVNHKRLKVRGKGKSIQFQFLSDTDKPFTIIGWSAFETANSEV